MVAGCSLQLHVACPTQKGLVLDSQGLGQLWEHRKESFKLHFWYCLVSQIDEPFLTVLLS